MVSRWPGPRIQQHHGRSQFLTGEVRARIIDYARSTVSGVFAPSPELLIGRI